MRMVIFALVTCLAVAAAGCAFAAAYVYLRSSGDKAGDERRARRLLLGTAVFGVGAVVLRYVSLLLFTL